MEIHEMVVYVVAQAFFFSKRVSIALWKNPVDAAVDKFGLKTAKIGPNQVYVNLIHPNFTPQIHQGTGCIVVFHISRHMTP